MMFIVADAVHIVAFPRPQNPITSVCMGMVRACAFSLSLEVLSANLTYDDNKNKTTHVLYDLMFASFMSEIKQQH